MAEVRKLVRCESCGAEAAYEPELIHGGCAEPFEVGEVKLFEGRDVQPLVEAARRIVQPTFAPRAYDQLREALQPFEDSKDDSTLGGDASATGDGHRPSTRVAEPGSVDDGSRLAQALAALDEIAARPTSERNPDGDEQAAETMALLARERAEGIRQELASEQQGGAVAREAARKLWEAATEHWFETDDDGDPIPLTVLLYDRSVAYPGLPIKGKELHRIGVELGFLDEQQGGER
jgi:hypothetical protein